ncbi:MAG: IS4 family transposase [Acidobacteria bacterium]|nr:IS4 family transposase [Acidobacteriota bacterium]
MAHSTLTVSDYQFLHALRQLFPTRLRRRAVACRRRATRQLKLPLALLLGLLLTWFLKPQAGLPFLLRWSLGPGKDTPTEAALYRARGRLGWAPLRWLRKHVVRPLADLLRDPDAFYHGRRLLALDGTTLTLADTPANERTFGRPRNQHRAGGYPQARVVALCEVGTHALIAWVVRGCRRAEVELARRLWRRVPAGALLLADRNFHAFDLWRAARDGGFDLLLRVQRGPKLPAQRVLADGSYLSAVLPRRGPDKKGRAIVVRVIRYRWTDGHGQSHLGRLATSLLDAAAHPAAALVELYHRRWEQELVFGEIKGQLAGRPMHIRAHEPGRVCQEVEALLLGHYAVRWVMLQAARQAGVPAVALSLTGSVRVLEVQLARVPQRPEAWGRWWQELLTAVGRQRLRPRRRRRCPRARKVTRSHWPLKKGLQEGTIPQLEVVPPDACDDP